MNTLLRGPRDRKVVDVHDPIQLLRWAQYFGKTPQAVAQAVAAVGADAEDVAQYLEV